jgi:hypothetical protein
MIKLNELIHLSTAFSAEVNLGRDYHYQLTGEDPKIQGYLPSISSRKIMRTVLDALPSNTDRKVHLIQASYGTGKSYLLLIIANLLGNNRAEALSELRQKIDDKEDNYEDGLGKALKHHVESGSRFLVVIPDYGSADFSHALLQGLNNALQDEKIEYVPITNYRRAAEVLIQWKSDDSENYRKFSQLLTNKTYEQFTSLLKSTDASTYKLFKTFFKQVVKVDFSEAHADDAYTVYAETAKELIKNYGYRGIAVFYDEFGDMLSRMINSAEGSGLPVQQFIEKVKAREQGANILFLSATHQDPSALRQNQQQDISKITGRFAIHKLDVDQAEAEEVIGTVFIHPDADGFNNLLHSEYLSDATRLIIKHKLYPNRNETWISEKILKGLYPLHPLTAYMLPRLSARFAQSSRSMFNFLNPFEQQDGSLAIFLIEQ